ncbi:MAG: hypothetical protein LUC24_00630 [Bacteroidales bacterium]|nr:hypothetical protein [Bacteroidales bacterium]
MEILCRVTAAGFTPKYGSDWEKKRKLREGSDVVLTARKARSAGLHRKFFALVRLVADNLPEEKAAAWHAWDEEGMLRKFKRDLGYYTVWYNERGEREIEYVSIAFERMDQWEFERFYGRCVDLVLRDYLPDLNREDLVENIENFM